MTQRLKKIPFKIWFFLFAIVMFTTSVVNLQGVGAETQQADIDRYSRDNSTLRRAIVRYHNDMNDLFDEKIEVLLAKDPDDPDVMPPNIIEGEGCSDTNVSTFCVAMDALDKYEAFREAMLVTHLPYYTDDPAIVYEGENTVYYEIGAAVDEFTYRQNLVKEQLEIAEMAMDATIASYNEIYMFYQLHLEYTQLIKDLEDYRDGLAEIRKQVEAYPSKFHNRMTTACT